MAASHKASRALVALVAANMAAIPLAVNLSNAAAWYFEDIKQRGTIAALCWIVTSLVTYRNLPFKMLAALAGCYFTADVIMWPVWLWMPDVYAVSPYLTTLTAAALCVWYCRRSYSWPSDGLRAGWVHIVRRRPAGVQDLLIAMLGRQPLGGVSVMIDGVVWRYRRGRLTRGEGLTDPTSYVIMRVRPADADTLRQLAALEGSRWTIARNCLTTLWPIALNTKWGALLPHLPSKRGQ